MTPGFSPEKELIRIAERISIENEEIAKLSKDRDDEMRIVEEGARERIRNMLRWQGSRPRHCRIPKPGFPYLKKNETITGNVIDMYPTGSCSEMFRLKSSNQAYEDEVVRIIERFSDQKHFWKMHYRREDKPS